LDKELIAKKISRFSPSTVVYTFLGVRSWHLGKVEISDQRTQSGLSGKLAALVSVFIKVVINGFIYIYIYTPGHKKLYKKKTIRGPTTSTKRNFTIW
jgi:hypothetical protein